MLGFTLAVGLAMNIVVSTARSGPQAWDDISDYDGTKCSAGQFYNATSGQCATAVVTNDPQAPIPQNSVGISDPGKQCAETQMYSVSDGKCMPEMVTNDAQAVVTPEGEDPTAYTVPTVTTVPK
jgi:hypothetical protein